MLTIIWDVRERLVGLPHTQSSNIEGRQANVARPGRVVGKNSKIEHGARIMEEETRNGARRALTLVPHDPV